MVFFSTFLAHFLVIQLPNRQLLFENKYAKNWKKEKFIIFCLVFPKNVQENIGSDAYRILKMLSEVYENLTEYEIKKRIELNELMEI